MESGEFGVGASEPVALGPPGPDKLVILGPGGVFIQGQRAAALA